MLKSKLFAACALMAALAAPILSAGAADFSNSKVAVVYFTLLHNREFAPNDSQADKKAGNAEVLARLIADKTGGDLFELKTVNLYPSDQDDTVDQAKEEQRVKARPQLQSIPDIAAYDTVFLSFPNWWGSYPMAVATYIEAVDLSGKTVVPVCTHEGSRMGRSEADLKQALPQSTVLKGFEARGRSVSDSGTEKRLDEFLQQL